MKFPKVEKLLPLAILLVGSSLLTACRPIVAPPATAIPTPAATDLNPLAGHWEGAIEVMGQSLAIALELTQADGGWTGLMDIPMQGAVDLPVHDITVDGEQIAFAILEGPRALRFTGALGADGIITGTFAQAGVEGTITLKPAASAAPAPAAAPTPAAALPYRAEEVTYTNGDVTLAGTLTLPEGDGPFPAAILLTGSGQQDRDETLPMAPGYRIFGDLADTLTRAGIAVLRADDRGVGGSTGDPMSATTADFADDARAGLAFLQGRSEIDPAAIGLIGHSEGSIIAGMVAADNPDIAFVVALAGPSVPGDQILTKQIERVALAGGATPEKAAAGAEAERKAVALMKAQDWAALETFLTEESRKSLEDLTPEQRAAITDEDQLIADRISLQMQQIKLPWMQYFLAYDPAQDWARITAPVLAFFGELDVQVDAGQNRPPPGSSAE